MNILKQFYGSARRNLRDRSLGPSEEDTVRPQSPDFPTPCQIRELTKLQ